MACFRVDYCGRGELADRQQKLNQFLSKLTHMAEEFNVCVLMVYKFRLTSYTLCMLYVFFAESTIDEPSPIRPRRQHSICRC